jgi:hypothetical protein
MSPYALQTIMFFVTIKEQANDEQQAYWLPKAESWEIIGSYAQVSKLMCTSHETSWYSHDAD